MDKEEIVWTWGKDDLQMPHNPSLLDNGNVLIFDNGNKRRYSRVIEVNPVTGEIVWEYVADTPEDFFAPNRGGAQGLPNGNVLITESTKGHVFEVTRDGEIVWEFWNPEISGDRRGTIYRMNRITLDEWGELSESLG